MKKEQFGFFTFKEIRYINFNYYPDSKHTNIKYTKLPELIEYLKNYNNNGRN